MPKKHSPGEGSAAGLPLVHSSGSMVFGTPLDLTRPSAARVYDFLLGGKDNYPADRQAAERLLEIRPDARLGARANRAFLRRSVAHLSELGVRQFIDIGSGLPTVDNTHEVAQRIAPESRIVYVDNDPLVLSHARALLASNSRTTVVDADMHDPLGIIRHPHVQEHLDLSRPVAVLMVAVLHFVTDQRKAEEIVRVLLSRLPAGSHIVISHFWDDGNPDTKAAQEAYSQAAVPATMRTLDRIAAFFDGLEPVGPGVAHVLEWLTWQEEDEIVAAVGRPALRRLPLVCGIGRKIAE